MDGVLMSLTGLKVTRSSSSPASVRQTMLTRGGMRSSALARAQAQLSGQRVPLKRKDSTDELKEYMNALNRKTSALKLSQPSIKELSDISAGEQENELNKGTESPHQAPSTQSRFLKKKSNAIEEKPWGPKSNGTTAKENGPPVQLHNPVKSKMPTSAALKRLAEIENRHRLRRLQLEMSENDTDFRTSDERPFSARSSSDLSTRATRFVKKKTDVRDVGSKTQKGRNVVWNNLVEGKRMSLESEEEEILQVIGSSVEKSEDSERWWKLPKPPRTPSPPSKGTPRKNLHRSTSSLGFYSPRRTSSRFTSRTPSPPSQGTPKFHSRTRSLGHLESRSPSPSVRSSLTNASTPRTRLGRRSHTPRSQRSDLQSLDELFTRAEDLSSTSSNDFKLNILSLDELVPTVDGQEVKEKETVDKVEKDINLISTTKNKASSRDKKVKLSLQKKSTSEDESVPEIQTEDSEVSEHLHKYSSDSSQGPRKERSPENTLNSAYSEDFEEYVYTTTSENLDASMSKPNFSPKTPTTERSSSRNHSSKPKQREKWAEKVQRITTREVAVQTNEPGFAYHWPHPVGSHDQFPELAFVDPVPIASHVVSPDLIEALTTYSPMALALNDMLKQQLLLTKSFIDMTRQLHHSTLSTLEVEMYHYTTLEETKEYIRQQKSLKGKQVLGEANSSEHSGLTLV